MESTIHDSVEESVWHVVLHSLKIEGTCESYKSSEEASSESGCVGIAILLLQVTLDNKSSLVFEKISVFIELVGEYPHQRHSISSVSCDVWIGKSALLLAAVKFCYSSILELLLVCVAVQLLLVTWWRRKIVAMKASRIMVNPWL
jgi:hypothetical protein